MEYNLFLRLLNSYTGISLMDFDFQKCYSLAGPNTVILGVQGTLLVHLQDLDFQPKSFSVHSRAPQSRITKIELKNFPD